MPKPTKKNLLKETIEHIDITRLNVRKLVDSWRKMSFSSRDTANATDIYNMMLGDKKNYHMAHIGRIHQRGWLYAGLCRYG